MEKYINKNNISIFFITLISAFLAISYSLEQEAVDGGLILSDSVKYPENSIMKIYYNNLYSFLHQYTAFFIKLNFSLLNISRSILFFSTLFYFLGIYLTVRSITLSHLLAFFIALAVIIFRKNFGNVDYPTLMFSGLTFSMMGLSIVTLIFGLISSKNLIQAGFFSSFLLSVHTILGAWICSMMLLTFILERSKNTKNGTIFNKKFIYGFLVGLFILTVSLYFFNINKIQFDQSNFDKKAYDTFIRLWDSHRVISGSFFESLHYLYLIKTAAFIITCVFLLKYFLINKYNSCYTLTIILLLSGIFSTIIYISYKLYPMLFPDIIVSIIPGRLILIHSVIGLPVIMSGFYIFLKNLLIKHNINAEISRYTIIIILSFYSVSHYKNIVYLFNGFISQINFKSLNNTDKEFWKNIYENKIDGYVLTGNDMIYYQVIRKARKPALLNIGLMDMIPYMPITAGKIKKIIEEVYNIPFNKPPIKHVLRIPKSLIRKNFEAKTKNDWMKLNRELKIKSLIVTSDWKINLPIIFASENYSYYLIID